MHCKYFYQHLLHDLHSFCSKLRFKTIPRCHELEILSTLIANSIKCNCNVIFMVILNSVHFISCHRPVSAGLLSYIYIYMDGSQISFHWTFQSVTLSVILLCYHFISIISTVNASRRWRWRGRWKAAILYGLCHALLNPFLESYLCLCASDR